MPVLPRRIYNLAEGQTRYRARLQQMLDDTWDETALLVLEADDHFTPEGLARLEALTDRLEGHPLVERVISVASAQQMKLDPEDPDTLLIDRFVREGQSPAAIRRALLADDLMRGTLVSDDGRLLLVLVQSVDSSDDVAQQPGVREALVAVGAMIVGRIRVVYDAGIGTAHESSGQEVKLPQPFPLSKGAELGRFELGSSVILLFRRGEANLLDLPPGETVRMGEAIGSLNRGIGTAPE
ncbi:MAG: phosphatidylserine decarboxylase [SAR324 cluster bacterium]|nr:phosphatidylserine decarboxylase [SAR324 cluster bacterium]